MNSKRILGLVVLIVGVILLFVSHYIEGRVAEGQEQVKGAQKKVNQGNSLFSLSPATKDAGQQLTKGAQKKIDAGKQQISHYADIADQLQVGGILLVIVGAGIILICRNKKDAKKR